MDTKLIVSASPHLRSEETTQSLMANVIVALCPCVVASAIIFGARALLVTAVSVVSFVSVTVCVAVPPVVILKTCPGYIKLGFLILFSEAICGYFVPLPRYFLAIAQSVSPFLTT